MNYSKYIIKQLGLKKEKQILKYPSLKKYHPSFISFNLNGSNKYVYQLRSPNFQSLSQIKKKVNKAKSIRKNYPKEGWQVLLTKDPKNSDVPHLCRKKCTGSIKFQLDRGHLIASKFEKYICTMPKSSFFYKGKDKIANGNVILQFKNANENSGFLLGKAYFEKEIIDYFNDNDSVKKDIYYQVEPIYFKREDKVPIGTRLLAFYFDSIPIDFNKKFYIPFHVFIPNCQYPSTIKSTRKKGDRKNIYRQFYKYGKSALT